MTLDRGDRGIVAPVVRFHGSAPTASAREHDAMKDPRQARVVFLDPAHVDQLLAMRGMRAGVLA